MTDTNRPTLVSADAEVVALLQQLVDEIRGLRADLGIDRRRPTLSRADRERLARLLPAIGGVFGSDPFVVHELADRPAVRLVSADLSPRQLGRLLLRALDVPIDGLVVERVGTELHRTIWRVVATL